MKKRIILILMSIILLILDNTFSPFIAIRGVWPSFLFIFSIAYSIILLRNDGYPCVFYGDYYGIEHDHIEPVNDLKTLMLIRKEKSYGLQHDYFDHNNFIGWTQEGDDEHISSGLAVVISNAGDGYKRMYVGNQNVGETYIDCLGNCEEEVTIDEEGCGNFGVKSRSVSVWIKK